MSRTGQNRKFTYVSKSQQPLPQPQQPQPQRGGATPSSFAQTQAYTKPHEFHGPLPETDAPPLLLSDEQMRSFLLRGYIVLQPSSLPAAFHEYISQKMQSLPDSDKYGNNCLPALPALNQVFADPTIKGALVSLLGPKFGMQPHKAVHLSPPGKGPQQWHRDTFWGYKLPLRYPKPWMMMGMYYPQATTVQMGATAAKPGTQYYTMDPKRYQGNLPNHAKEDDPMDTNFSCPAGSVAFIHYDLIHKGTANKSQSLRYMFKFQFYRTEQPTTPTWNCTTPEWSPLVATEGPHSKFLEPVCHSIWNWLCGKVTTETLEDAEVPGLVSQLDSPSEKSRFYAAFRLGLSGKLDILFTRLLHSDEQMRFCAAYAIACSPSSASGAETLTEWLKDKPKETKMLIVWILSEWGMSHLLLRKLDTLVKVREYVQFLFIGFLVFLGILELKNVTLAPVHLLVRVGP
eukprot:TRINITY_DN1477_c0_g1_i2.p1 TRINITY_DN1477_c0_g1~~TRINITY_DN1477_c0_g1_i2.p1  ORF type:complete len:457 (+),score=61.17 TRINITY_DN1477_c0_g1_i2:43-1413(+)